MRKLIIGCFLPALCPFLPGFAQAAGKPVSVSFGNETGFAVSPLLFGTQSELWVTTYLSTGQIQFYKDLGVTLLRYPGGTSTDWFMWRDPKKGYWPAGLEKRRIMYPEPFLALCKRWAMTPIIQVNTSMYETHDPAHRINPTKVESIRKGAAYAAEWVREANIKNKAGVKYWEIGNETWIWMQAKENARHVAEYSKAMKAVDPSIRIIACGLGHDTGGFAPSWLDRDFKNDPTWKPRQDNSNRAEDWTKALLRDANGTFDYIALHIYLGSKSPDAVVNGRETFAQIAHLDELDQQIAWIRQARSPVRLAVTEWMTNFYHCTIVRKEKDYHLSSPAYAFVNTLLAADFFGTMINTGHVDIAVAHDMTDMLADAYCDPTHKVLDPPLELPAGAALRFWKTYSGDRTVKVNLVDCPFYEFEGKKIPLLSAYATAKGANPDKVYLILINRSPKEAINISIDGSFNKRPPATVTEHTLSAKSWSTTVWSALDKPERHPFKSAARTLNPDDLRRYPAGPCRLTCLEFAY